ncbi:PucR family transcriptional regulator [Streptomyces sp. TRM43335]|uniref:PucR family transcriptional regulator n=1 Tax=Streptomyces taklimakanensis TaxID=2569853 RepID=A0A6G2BFT7_9ACTN|nr:helix-turn-helix domain-containing protein [Streptomyces taklimakanensis]MTE21145.1 PucR family transcriptional regulator [Streptomyces taklimakanensis]
MHEDYQALVDEVTALLGTPATLENRDFGLIAFGAHEGDGDGDDAAPLDAALMDPVRTSSILRRRSSARVRAWFESFGITRATGPVRIPPDPSAGVLRGRICVPARHGGVTLGYIWLLDDGALELSDPRLADVRAVADRVGGLLAAESRTSTRLGELLRTLLTAPPGQRAAERAETELAQELGAAAAGPLTMVAVVPWGEADEEPTGLASPAPGGGIPGVLAGCVVPLRPVAEASPTEDAVREATGSAGGLAVLVRLRTLGGTGPARTAAERLLRSPRAGTPGSPGAAAGIGEPRTGLGGVTAAWRQALAAARAARAERRFGPVARWDGIGPYRMLAVPGGPAGPPDPSVRTLLEPDRRELARTAEAFLDCAGQAGRTATLLGVHRQTLYYRLSKVEQLTGLDLDDGEDRLLLHMALKSARLLRT